MSNNTTRSDSAPSRPDGDDSSEFYNRFDDGPRTVIVSVVEAVAAVVDREFTAMSPLYDAVDPEALTDIVTSAREQPVNVSFSYEGCSVTVSSDGYVVVEPPEN